jgi:hypothetical protein
MFFAWDFLQCPMVVRQLVSPTAGLSSVTHSFPSRWTTPHRLVPTLSLRWCCLTRDGRSRRRPKPLLPDHPRSRPARKKSSERPAQPRLGHDAICTPRMVSTSDQSSLRARRSLMVCASSSPFVQNPPNAQPSFDAMVAAYRCLISKVRKTKDLIGSNDGRFDRGDVTTPRFRPADAKLGGCGTSPTDSRARCVLSAVRA